MVYTGIVDFAWDERKSQTNVAKHGIAFKVAITAFDDPFQLRAPQREKGRSSREEAI